uniref:Uncharacterized protein n=1 Tax=Heterorhabditis bacteriophora TaxID=37862 RepID=A0A1I7WIU8_HETBA
MPLMRGIKKSITSIDIKDMKNSLARYSLTIPSIPENIVASLRQWNEWMASDLDRPSASHPLLPTSSMVRQQSDTTGVRRLVRGKAIDHDRPQTSQNKPVLYHPLCV